MLEFLKKLFQKKLQPVSQINLVESVDPNFSLSFEIGLGFDVEVSPTGDPNPKLRVNRLVFVSNNEPARQYINAVDGAMLKETISMLCLGASQHILTTSQEFQKNPTLDPTPQPILDKSQLN